MAASVSDLPGLAPKLGATRWLRKGFTFSPVDRSFTNQITNVTNVDFTAFPAGQLQRNLTISTVFANAPTGGATGTVSVPVTLNSLGNERQINFSATFAAPLSNPTVTCTTAALALGCVAVPNVSQAGAIGVSVTLAQAPAAGQLQLVTLNFTTAANSGTFANAPVQFGDSPVPRLTTDVAGNALATTYTSGLVVFSGAGRGLEADVATRFNGDGVYRANDVEQIRRFIAGLDQPNGSTNEFQRADVAPYVPKGDGRLRADDLQLAQNYVAVLVPQQTAGGPTQPIAAAAPLEERDSAKDVGRAMRIVSGTVIDGKVTVTVEMDSLGDETVALFTLNFDASLLRNPVVDLAEERLAEGVTITANTEKGAEGMVTVPLDSATPITTGYSKRLVTVTFDVAKGVAVSEIPITFNDSGSLSDAEARSLDAVYTDGVIGIKMTTIRGGLSFFNQNLFRFTNIAR